MNETIMGYIIGIIGVILTHFIQEHLKKLAIVKTNKSYNSPVKIPLNDKRNSVLLLGIGGTGKTSLIKAILNNKDANPNEKTENFEIYRGSRQSEKDFDVKDEKNISRHWFYIADYMGQNIGQLVRSFIVQQKKPYSPLAYRYVTSLILMVDLIPPKKEYDSKELKKTNAPNRARVKKHLLEWNGTALDAIFGLLTRELKYISIFINKIDLMLDRSQDAEKEYIEMFQDLQEKIEKRSDKAVVKIYLGSAKRGTEINHLIEDLMKYSEYNKIEDL